MAGKIALPQAMKMFREMAGLTQNHLAIEIKKTSQFISDIENGRRVISMDVVLKYIDALNTAPKTMMKLYYDYTLDLAGLGQYEVEVKERNSNKKRA